MRPRIYVARWTMENGVPSNKLCWRSHCGLDTGTKKPPEIWDSTSGLGKPQADVVIAPQYQTENCRIDLAVFINIFPNEETKIAVECDGHNFHAKVPEQVARDTARNGDLTIAGWRLQRFTGRQIRRERGRPLLNGQQGDARVQPPKTKIWGSLF